MVDRTAGGRHPPGAALQGTGAGGLRGWGLPGQGLAGVLLGSGRAAGGGRRASPGPLPPVLTARSGPAVLPLRFERGQGALGSSAGCPGRAAFR